VGTWGYGPFDSDYAQDFLEELASVEDVVGHLREVLSKVADASGLVDAVAGDEAAVAAALAAVRFGGVPVDPELAEDLAAFTFDCPEDLRSLVSRTFDRLLNPVANGWYDLWVQSNGIDQVAAEFEPFRQAVAQT
jgi:hypothetical protein